MVNTKTGEGINQLAHIRRRRVVTNLEPQMNTPNPSPTESEAFFTAQIQLLQQMSIPWLTRMPSSTITSNTHIHHHHPEISITNS
jgi:hypothetical protein